MPKIPGGSWGGGRFLMGEVPLYREPELDNFLRFVPGSHVPCPDFRATWFPVAFPRQSAGGVPGVGKACQDTIPTFEDQCLEGKLSFGDPFLDSGVVSGSRMETPLIHKLGSMKFTTQNVLY